MVGEGLKLAEELNLPKDFALDSEEAIRLLAEKTKRKNTKFCLCRKVQY